MAESAIKLEVTGTLDPDQMLFALCLAYAFKFGGTWEEFRARVEDLIDLCETSAGFEAVH